MTLKPIVILSGIAGTGKTTLARYLSCKLPFDHRIGTGFIREVLRSTMSREKFPSLHTHTFRPIENVHVVDNYVQQCSLMVNGINACIKRAKIEGTSLLMEGSNVIPNLINLEQIDLFVVLLNKDKAMLQRNLKGESHKNRSINDKDFKNNLRIQNYLIAEAKKITNHRLLVVENKDYNLVRDLLLERVSSIFNMEGVHHDK